MKFWFFLTGFALATVFSVSPARAGIWDNIGAFRAPTNTILQAELAEEPIGPLSFTYSGSIARFEVTYNEQGAAECNATIATGENSSLGLVARLTSFPPIRDEPGALISLLRQSAICFSAQNAYLRNQNVTVTGEQQKNSGGVAGQLNHFMVKSFSLATDSSFSSVRPEIANVCNQLSCSAEGVVRNLTYSLNDSDFLCQATLAIPQADQRTALATVTVDMRGEFCRKDLYCDAETMKLLFARLQACQLLEKALDTERPVKVLGYGQGGTVSAVSITIDNQPPADLNPMF